MRRKYLNKKINVDGITFDSQKEYKRYLVLCKAQEDGVISNLDVHPSFCLLPNQYCKCEVKLKTKTKVVDKLVERSVTYSADFVYFKNNEMVVEDVKISKYLMPQEFILKRKMMFFFYGIMLKLVFNPNDAI